MTLADAWRRGQIGWPRRFPIAQFPNPPLLVSFAGSILAALTDGRAHGVGRAAATLGLGIWAWGEALEGVNWFRRVLGTAALVLLVVRLAGEL